MVKKRLLLRALRAAHEPKLTQLHISRMAGMGVYRYWQIEHGEGLPPSRDERIEIAAALGCAVDDIDWPVPYRQEATA